MKKTISIIISFIMLASLFLTAIPAQAEEVLYRCSDYDIKIFEGTYGDCRIISYKGDEINIEIPSKINYNDTLYGIPRIIGDACFAECNAVSVTIPDTVVEIKKIAFGHCVSLEKVVVPPSVTDIYDDAFEYCDKLTIYGYTNSIAEKHAKEHNIPFESIGVYTEPTTPPTPTTKKPVNTVKTTAPTKPTKPIVKTKKATIKKLTPKKKALKVTWKKVSGAKGYEIKLATNKKFTKNKKTVKVKKGSATSQTIKKLKSGKKYYVKIRAYKKVTIDGYTVTANGPWSKIKSKKVK